MFLIGLRSGVLVDVFLLHEPESKKELLEFLQQ